MTSYGEARTQQAYHIAAWPVVLSSDLSRVSTQSDLSKGGLRACFLLYPRGPLAYPSASRSFRESMADTGAGSTWLRIAR